MQLQTNTRIAPIVDVSTYDNGTFSYSSLWEGDEEAEREEGRFVCNDYDQSKVGEKLVEEANRVFAKHKPLSEYGVVSIKATKFGSPRFYNFETDWLDLDIEVDDTFWDKARDLILQPNNRKRIVAYAADHWVSYDGFMSTMLNRLKSLSRDTWRHKEYGTPMATDAEIEGALVADLIDAFYNLQNSRGLNEIQEMGAILMLMWNIEYPADVGGTSWVSEDMYEHMRGNSSLSEFCTVIPYDEMYRKIGESLIDFNGHLAATDAQYRKYLECGVGEDSKKRAAAWMDAFRNEIAEWSSEQNSIIEREAPKWDAIRDELDDMREDWENRLKAGWPGAWK